LQKTEPQSENETILETEHKMPEQTNGTAAMPEQTNVMQSGVGMVWNVVSGDTIEVCVDVKSGNAQFKKITLAGVMAPKLGIGAGQKDEPGAWASKEFLRKMVLAKKVQFRQFYESGGRSFNEVRIVGESKHIGTKVLEAGFARVAPGKQIKELPFYSELEAAAEAASLSSQGMFSSTEPFNTAVRDVANCHMATIEGDFDLDTWYTVNKNKERTCVIEHIKDAAAMRVCVLPEGADTKYVTIMVTMSGIQNPTLIYKKIEATGASAASVKEEEATPGNGAFYARSFAQERLLGREVKLRLESLEKNSARGYMFTCSLLHPVKGSIAEAFLDAGFASYVDWSAQNSVSGPDALKNAQKRAQDARKGRWKNWDGTSSGLDSWEFNGKVVEICSGDVMRIINVDTRDEKRYYLSSVRAPQGARSANEKEKCFSEAAIEFMRKKCIGKLFKVRVDYKKNISVFQKAGANNTMVGNTPPPSDEATGDMYFVSLYDAHDQNPAIEAIREGLLQVIAPRGAESQNERSRDFDDMKTAEDESKESGKHYPTAASAPKPDQYTQLILAQGAAGSSEVNSKSNVGVPRGAPTTKKQLVERAKAFEDQLKAKKAGHDGIVTFIMNGSRMRIKLIHEKLLLTFQMDGVRAPNAERGANVPANANVPKAEPFGNESLAFARESVMQQDVKVMINRVDPSGTFVGNLYYQKGNKKEDLANSLLERGLAYTDGWTTNPQHLAAEERAKKAKQGWWSIDHGDDANVEDTSKQVKSGTAIKGEVYHINGINSFYLVPCGGEHLKIINECQTAAKSPEFKNCDATNNRPKKNKLYLAQFWEDKKFYRAKFEGKAQDPGYNFSMLFIDTGMVMDCDVVKEIPLTHDLNKKPAVAQHCTLYGIKTTDEYEYEAGEAFFKKTNKKQVSGTVDGVFYDNGVYTQKLSLTVGGVSLQESLLKEAVCKLTRKEKSPTTGDYKAWTAAETAAKRAHNKLWQYGDVGSDDEDY